MPTLSKKGWGEVEVGLHKDRQHQALENAVDEVVGGVQLNENHSKYIFQV